MSLVGSLKFVRSSIALAILDNLETQVRPKVVHLHPVWENTFQGVDNPIVGTCWYIWIISCGTFLIIVEVTSVEKYEAAADEKSCRELATPPVEVESRQKARPNHCHPSIRNQTEPQQLWECCSKLCSSGNDIVDFLPGWRRLYESGAGPSVPVYLHLPTWALPAPVPSPEHQCHMTGKWSALTAVT